MLTWRCRKLCIFRDIRQLMGDGLLPCALPVVAVLHICMCRAQAQKESCLHKCIVVQGMPCYIMALLEGLIWASCGATGLARMGLLYNLRSELRQAAHTSWRNAVAILSICLLTCRAACMLECIWQKALALSLVNRAAHCLITRCRGLVWRLRVPHVVQRGYDSPVAG